MTKWEEGPWNIEISYHLGGGVSRVKVIGAKERLIMMSTMAPLVRNRAGQLEPTAETKMTTTSEKQPAVICDCGIPYAGLSPETLIANGDLISAAPEMHQLLAEILGTVPLAPYPDLNRRIQTAIFKAQGVQI